jgi:hypothetical protein
MRLLLIMMIFTIPLFAYELQIIQAVSSTGKSFVTRNGRKSGLVPGITGTFTANNVSILAKARTVTGEFTQWEIINPELVLPFQKGETVTYYNAEEYLWTLSPDEFRRKMIKSLREPPRSSMTYKAGFTKGYNESVSGAAATESNRGGVLAEILYEKSLYQQLYFDAGVRYEREVSNIPAISILTQRMMVLGHLLYYFEPFGNFYRGRIFIGGGLGYGQSSSEVANIVQSGQAVLLPSAKLGFTMPFNKNYEFVLEAAFETIQTSERLEDKSKQTTTQTNGRTGFGLRRYF